VIVRLSDFKSNEYANLIGGSKYEPHEENPMLGSASAAHPASFRWIFVTVLNSNAGRCAKSVKR
jgi:phosphoenolpyruvate synthase/pyruvate phosphate dikinase